jgi:hypothetical protein
MRHVAFHEFVRSYPKQGASEERRKLPFSEAARIPLQIDISGAMIDNGFS